MLDLSHEANFAMQTVTENVQELCSLVQDAAVRYATQLQDLRIQSTVSGSIIKGSPLRQRSEAAGVGFETGGTTAVQKGCLEDVLSMLRTFQRATLVLRGSYETLAAALAVDIRKKTTASQPAPIVFPWTRVIPHPSLFANASPARLPLSSRDGGQRLLSLNSTIQSLPPLHQQSVATPGVTGMSPSSPRLGAPSFRGHRATITADSNAHHNNIHHAASAGGGLIASSSHHHTDDGSDTVASSFYFCFDAICRCLHATEAAMYIQKSQEDAQAVCVFGGKPRHPSTVYVSLRSGVVGSVIKSGIALNIVSEDSNNTGSSNNTANRSNKSGNATNTVHSLCLPLFESTNRTQPIGAVMFDRSGPLPFTEHDVALGHLWTSVATQFLVGYGVDLVSNPYDPFQFALRQGTRLSEFLKAKPSSTSSPATTLASASTKPLTSPADPLHGVLENTAKDTDKLLNTLLGSAYPPKLAATIAAQTPPQLVFTSSHRNHGYQLRPSEFKGHVELLRYQNVMDVAAYIKKLSDSWRRSTDDLHGMEMEQISQLQDLKQGMRKLKSVNNKLESTTREANDYRERYEVLKRELAQLVAE